MLLCVIKKFWWKTNYINWYKYVWQYFIIIQSNIECNLLSKNFTNGVVFFSFNQQETRSKWFKIYICMRSRRKTMRYSAQQKLFFALVKIKSRRDQVWLIMTYCVWHGQ